MFVYTSITIVCQRVIPRKRRWINEKLTALNGREVVLAVVVVCKISLRYSSIRGKALANNLF